MKMNSNAFQSMDDDDPINGHLNKSVLAQFKKKRAECDRILGVFLQSLPDGWDGVGMAYCARDNDTDEAVAVVVQATGAEQTAANVLAQVTQSFGAAVAPNAAGTIDASGTVTPQDIPPKDGNADKDLKNRELAVLLSDITKTMLTTVAIIERLTDEGNTTAQVLWDDGRLKHEAVLKISTLIEFLHPYHNFPLEHMFQGEAP